MKKQKIMKKYQERVTITSLDKVITIRNDKDYKKLMDKYPLIDYTHNWMVVGINYSALVKAGVDCLKVYKKQNINISEKICKKIESCKFIYFIFNKNLIIKEDTYE